MSRVLTFIKGKIMFKGLQGKRTYIIAVGAVVSAIVAFLTGEMTLSEAVNAGLVGAGLATLRAGVEANK
jgi:hypothetical protein